MKDIIFTDNLESEEVPIDYAQTHFTHILCQSGKAQLSLNDKNYSIKENDMVILLPNAKIQDFNKSSDFKAINLLVSFELMSRNNPDIGWGIKGYLFAKRNPVVGLSKKVANKCRHNFLLLKEKWEDDQHLFKMPILNLQLQMFVMEMWNIFADKIEQEIATNEKGSLFQRFLQLVEVHCLEHREVEFYADLLYITPKYLSEICKKTSGKNASEWIQNYTATRLMLLLRNERLSFTEIAYSMQFSSQSHFSRYVKKILGVSPSEYRNRLK